jgi:protein-tyrosine kinase
MKAQQSSLLGQIRQVHDNRKTGVLTLSKADKRVSVFYRDGMIEAASANLKSHRLGDYLIREEYLTDDDVQSVLSEAQRDQTLFGETAVRRNFLTPPELAEITRHQAIGLLKHSLSNGFMKASFSASMRPFYAPAKISFACLQLELFRSNSVPFEGDATFGLMGDRDISELSWYPEELCVLTELTRPTTVSGLLASTGIEESALRRILGVVNQMGIIQALPDPRSMQPVEGSSTLAPKEQQIVKGSSLFFERLIPVVADAVIGEKVEVLKNASSFISEQFKTLKVRLSDNGDTAAKVITVSSPDREDGKSLISANLALTFSMDPGRRVVILDCDFRGPSLDSYLGVRVEPGLLQYLSNGHMSPYCFMRRLKNLFFLTSGGIALNPIELLSLQKMKDLIECLKADFDTIILDAPPLLPIADARIVTGLGDGLVMVIRQGKTSCRSIEAALKVTDHNKLLGVVFNDVKPMLFSTYYNRDYYNYGRDIRHFYSSSRKSRSAPKKYLES